MSYNILVVDDSLPMRSVIIKTIKASGYDSANFFHAANGKEALEIMDKHWIDIVLTDYYMPGMNGIQFLNEMKEKDLLSETPVIIISSEGNQQRIDEFIKIGAKDYVRKPFTPEIIKSKLTKILGEPNYETSDEDSDEGLDF